MTKMRQRYAVIADDNTGATDAAGMLTAQGVRTVLLTDPEAPLTIPDEVEAVVIGTQNRSTPPEEAAACTRRAVEKAQALGANRFQIKYCSTFDSTKEGNIGPTLDAAREQLGVDRCIVCPALPVNGRIVRDGRLYVNGELLSDSPLSRHPLNPMTDANIVRWLGYQTKAKVGLLPLTIIRSGVDAVRKEMNALAQNGVVYVVTDIEDDADLRILAEAVQDHVLISGGSGITAAWPLMEDRAEPLSFNDQLSALGSATLVVSGSQSPTTRRQYEHAVAHGFADMALDVPAVLRDEIDLDTITHAAVRNLEESGSLIIHSLGDGPEAVKEIQALGVELGFDEVQTGEIIADTLGELAAHLIRRNAVGRLVISGGETSGAVCRKLDMQAFEVGLPLAPGVPYCFPLPDKKPLVVLKSGNFGNEDLYATVKNLK